MIAYLKGKVIAQGSNFLILENNGVGYKVFIGTYSLAKIGSNLEFYCYNNIREDCNDLFGFKNFEDLTFFEVLLSVSGVGPKVAQTIINNLGRERIIKAIEESDLNLFKSVPGVGTKVAAKIIVELKNKISGQDLNLKYLDGDETVDALLALGLTKHEILPALKNIPTDMVDVSSRIKFVLKHVAKK